ncbi:FTR1 family protein [uncultured Campylobacter sp.]|uniref:FTR1 family iron permease n=1 Tax=uncultured Campylobacter sp. TaxID=218934 RepID=UPI000F2A3FB7|nr:FTR1 family protein [uncultured Campylobacter sp.]RKV92602.1 MAG: FTR1 family iron permease [Campylobacter sp.]
MKFFKFAVLALIFPLAMLFADTDYRAEAATIKEKFAQAIKLYVDGNNSEARKITQEAYFGHFENLEAGIRINLGQKKSYDMEKQFGDIRKAIKAEKPLNEIQAMIDNLNREIDEVLPAIESGHRLVAEYQDGGDGSTSAPASGGNSAASGTTSPWMSVYTEFKTELDNAKAAFDKKDTAALKAALNRAKFDIYRNERLEEAVRKYVSSQTDQSIQQIIGNLLREDADTDKSKFDEAINALDNLALKAVNDLPQESYSIAPQTALAQSDTSEDEGKDFTPIVQNIKDKMAKVLQLYESGKVDDAIDESGNIYFDEYEESGMENIVGAKNTQLKLDTEASFNKISALMRAGASKEQIVAAQNKLFDQLTQSLELTKKSSNWDLFLYAFIIILREGFEALIIVAAVIALLIKSGNSKHLNIVYSALGVAVVLSIATAYGLNYIFGSENAGQTREVMEGAVMLIAVVLLFYVGFWLLSNASSKKWSAYIQGQISNSLSSGDSKMLWWTVFLAVYREGAETVLFYLALLFDAKSPAATSMVAAGFVAGLAALIIVYIVIKKFSLKIAIKPFFIATSVIIFYMSVVFVGKGVMELVEGKVFVPTVIDGLPTITWIGFYPYVQSLVPQAVMIVLLIVGILILKNKQKNKS